jgi:hypothetical protein
MCHKYFSCCSTSVGAPNAAHCAGFRTTDRVARPSSAAWMRSVAWTAARCAARPTRRPPTPARYGRPGRAATPRSGRTCGAPSGPGPRPGTRSAHRWRSRLELAAVDTVARQELRHGVRATEPVGVETGAETGRLVDRVVGVRPINEVGMTLCNPPRPAAAYPDLPMRAPAEDHPCFLRTIWAGRACLARKRCGRPVTPMGGVVDIAVMGWTFSRSDIAEQWREDEDHDPGPHGVHG